MEIDPFGVLTQIYTFLITVRRQTVALAPVHDHRQHRHDDQAEAHKKIAGEVPVTVSLNKVFTDSRAAKSYKPP